MEGPGDHPYKHRMSQSELEKTTHDPNVVYGHTENPNRVNHFRTVEEHIFDGNLYNRVIIEYDSTTTGHVVTAYRTPSIGGATVDDSDIKYLRR